MDLKCEECKEPEVRMGGDRNLWRRGRKFGGDFSRRRGEKLYVVKCGIWRTGRSSEDGEETK